METAGQHMQQESAHELLGRQRHGLVARAPLGPVVLPFKNYPALIHRNKPAARDSHPVRIARQVGQHRLGAGKRPLGIDHPLALAHRCQPLVEAGTVEIVADQWVENWDAANALKLMENILTGAGNDVDAVVASNDGTALGALQALSAQGLAGVVPISGQDATADGCNSIVKGELTVSILKDIRNLAPIAVDMVDALVKGEAVEGMEEYTLAELTLNDALQGNVKALFLPVEQVNADNVFDLCVANGFQAYDDVFRDIPEDQRPPKP